MDQLVRTMAVEWAQKGVRVNAIAPGYMENIMATAGEEHDRPEKQEQVRTFTPMGRRGTARRAGRPGGVPRLRRVLLRHRPHPVRRRRLHGDVMQAPILDYMQRHRFKKLQLCNDTATGLRAVIAIHSTALGPATGGLRMWTYADEQDAIMDALRLARGMTYKYAAAGVNLGGGKAVIIGDPKRDKTEALMRAMGRMIDQLGGEYITGEDVGTTLEDMETLYAETDHVVTLPEHCGGAGDISPATALGSIEAMRACAERAWGTSDLAGRRVALQGLGMVGGKALPMLVEAGAEVRGRPTSIPTRSPRRWPSTASRRSSRTRSTTRTSTSSRRTRSAP